MFDCIIVGGGPAGSAAAYHLAKAGREVLLLEKAKLPRYKPCSGAVSPSVARWFDFDFAPAIDSQTTRVRYTWKLGDAIDAQLESEPIWSVRREVFDHYLLEQAKAKGAQVQDQTAVCAIELRGDYWVIQCQTVGGETSALTSRYLIAADGAQGPTAQWLGFKPSKLRPAGILEISSSQPVENGAFCFEFGLVKQGCAWSFPKQQGYSLGVSSFIGKPLKDLSEPLKQYAPEFGSSFEAGQFYIHPLKLWDGNVPLHTERALLAGEAAAIVDPLTAEGIRPALYSGMLSAQAIDQALAGKAEALAQYSRTLHESWGADMQWAQRIAQVFFRVPKIGYRVGIKRPTATQRLGQILAGEVSYADISNRVIKRISTSFLPNGQ